MRICRRSCRDMSARWRGRLGGGDANLPPAGRCRRSRRGGACRSARPRPANSHSTSPLACGAPPARGRVSQSPRLMFMMSSGGLTAADMFQGKDALLSGPAGGVVGMVETAKLAGFDQVIGFDMGGTSTDVAHYDGEYERAFDTEVAGVRVRAPMMRIHTVAAGGGSILHFEAGRFRVGPDSAGANPGPACYRRGGPLAVTDANVMLGKLQPDFFPAIFGPGQDQPLDTSVVREKFAAPRRRDRRRPNARSRRRRFRHHRRREHGERHQEDFGAARLRRDRLSAQLLRRRRRPACLPGGRRARHAIGADPPLLRPAVGLRHRHVGRLRLAPARFHPAARRGVRRGDRRRDRDARRRRVRGTRPRRACRRTASAGGRRCTSATTAPTRRCR